MCIRYLNGRSPNVVQKLRSLKPVEVCVCSVVKFELFFGSQRTQNPTRTLRNQLQFLAPYQSFPFDDAAALEAGKIRASLANIGKNIGPFDVMIAAIAKVHELTLITHNVGEFSRVSGLLIEDWE